MGATSSAVKNRYNDKAYDRIVVVVKKGEKERIKKYCDPVASIGLQVANEHFEAAASGNGPVDAAIKALKCIIKREMTLKEFTIQAISKGSDDLAKVHQSVEYNGHIYYGFGTNTDIVTASVEAYIDAINKFRN